MHFMRNALAHVPKGQHTVVAAAIRALLDGMVAFVAMLSVLAIFETAGRNARNASTVASSSSAATGTASGKSLCYQLPVFDALLGDGHRTALYLSPTKALARDQLRAVRSFALAGIRASAYDGDTPAADRPMIRRSANLVLTNPDMLHRGILPGHERWAAFLGRLAYVVVDEAHTLRGVFGSHVAAFLRRLRRLAACYGASPTFVLASATLGNPAELAGRLVGQPVEAVTEDGSPRGPVAFALWEPPLLDETTGLRRSANTESAIWLAAAVEAGVRTLCFTRSRKSAELVATFARGRVAQVDRRLAGRVRAYRAGYLAEERRDLLTLLRRTLDSAPAQPLWSSKEGD